MERTLQQYILHQNTPQLAHSTPLAHWAASDFVDALFAMFHCTISFLEKKKTR